MKCFFVNPTALKVLGALAGTAWIIEGVVKLATPSQEFRFYILFSYLVIFGLLVYLLLLEVEFVLSKFEFTRSYAGKSIIFIFMAALAWGNSRWEIFIAIFTAYVGLCYIGFSICWKDHAERKETVPVKIVAVDEDNIAHENERSSQSKIFSPLVGSHTILLSQSNNNPSSKIWYNYGSLSQAIEGVITMFERELEASSPANSEIDYDIKDLFAYVDKLEDLGVMMLDPDKQVYSGKTKKWIKEQILGHLQKQAY